MTIQNVFIYLYWAFFYTLHINFGCQLIMRINMLNMLNFTAHQLVSNKPLIHVNPHMYIWHEIKCFVSVKSLNKRFTHARTYCNRKKNSYKYVFCLRLINTCTTHFLSFVVNILTCYFNELYRTFMFFYRSMPRERSTLRSTYKKLAI